MGVCLTGYFEIFLSLTPHTIAIGVNPWNHIMTVKFNKDYPLMHALRESDARHGVHGSLANVIKSRNVILRARPLVHAR